MNPFTSPEKDTLQKTPLNDGRADGLTPHDPNNRGTILPVMKRMWMTFCRRAN